MIPPTLANQYVYVAQVFANGAKSKTILKSSSLTVCNSVVYVTDTVLLPTTTEALIRIPTIAGLLTSLITGFTGFGK